MTDLIEVKTADLQGWQLAWAVAVAEELDPYLVGPHYGNPWRVFRTQHGEALKWERLYNPHEDWALAGALIEKYRVSLNDCGEHWGFPAGSQSWRANTARIGYGSNPLVALCRCIVSTQLGDTVQVPKELCQ